ncbi:MAG: DegT/DnrJ/EryC1/StrS family aminotransferase [Deltaproteobacteria bacterium]|nr:DegT/DnrJ/EryC1/StrS family aminotransferase [Deltaproteobacteria bacterium]
MTQLALFGGPPVRTTPLPRWNTIGAEEQVAARRVLESGVLSGYVGAWSPAFYGGPEVQMLECAWAAYFGVRHAIAVNSATSGLYAAIGALGIGPGDEVIVSPCSMSASATAPLIYGAMPVFADIDPATYTLHPDTVERAISARTRAILAVNLFGHPADLQALRQLARRHGIALIEDSAQAPGARYQDRYAGTIGEIGVFSLNCHKHIQTGEGGICVTNDDHLAERLQLIRNHAEAVVEARPGIDLANMIGWNYRMTELTAAIGGTQLEKLPQVLEHKMRIAESLRAALHGIDGLTPPTVRPDCSHVYYTFPLQIDAQRLGISRAQFTAALHAEGIPIVERYVKPLYLAPMFQQRMAWGRDGFPFTADSGTTTARRYPVGLCATAERLYAETLCYLPWCAYDFDTTAAQQVRDAIYKIVEQRDALRAYQP